MTRSRGKILVIRGGAIGDFILTIPALAALRQQFPETHLEVLGYAHIAQLALAGGLVDAVRSIDARSLAGFFARDGVLAEELQEYFASFAIVVSYLYDPDEIFRTNLARCSKAQFIAGPHRPDETLGLHATETFLKPLERVAVFDADPAPRLTLQFPRSRSAQLALHPGSGSERKNWPEPKWAELIAQLVQTTDWQFLLVGGEAEGDRLDRLAALIPPDRLQLARNLPLVNLAERLSQCPLFIGHDSGITHLAAALNVPACVLWSETLEEVWQPRGENVRLLRHPDGLAALPVQEVTAMVKDWRLKLV